MCGCRSTVKHPRGRAAGKEGRSEWVGGWIDGWMNQVESSGLVEQTARSNKSQSGPGPELIARLLAGGLGDGGIDRPGDGG